MRHVLPLLGILLTGALAAGETVSVNVWRDSPGEVLCELNHHLPVASRLAWYVPTSAELPDQARPVIAAEPRTVEALLAAYDAAAGTRSLRRDQRVWIWRPLPEAELATRIAAIGQGDATARRRAALALADAGSPEAVRAVLRALADADPETRKAAEAALAVVAGVPLTALGDHQAEAYAVLRPPGHLRQRVAGLGQRSGDLPAPWVAISLAVEEDPAVRAAIEQAVGQCPNLAADMPLLLVAACLKLDAAKTALGQWAADPRKTSQGDWMRRCPDWEVGIAQKNAAAALAAIFSPPAPADPAAALTGVLVKIKAVDITKALQEKDAGRYERNLEDVRRQVAELGRQHGPEVVAALVGLLEHGEGEVRAVAAEALSNHRDPAMVAPLAKVFHEDEQPRPRKLAARTLGQCRLPAAIEILKQGLANPASPVGRIASANGLAIGRCPEAGALLRAHLGKASSEDERVPCLQFLALTRDPEAQPFLIAIARDINAPLSDRIAAIAGLTWIPGKQSEGTLLAVLGSDAALKLREKTVEGLMPQRREDIPRCAPLLLRIYPLLSEESLQQKALQGLQLSARHSDAADPLRTEIRRFAVEVARAGNSNIRRTALETFRHSGVDAETVTALAEMEAAEKNPVMKGFISNALTKARQAMAAPAPAAPPQP